MATVTWLGSVDDAKECSVWRHTFKKGEALEITDEEILKRASRNPGFKVEGYSERPPGDEHKERLLYLAPSEQSAQGPVPKPGEPVIDPNKIPPAQPEPEPEPEPESVMRVSAPAPSGRLKPMTKL